MNVLALLLLAHFLGDFALQPSSWVNSKFKNGLKSIGFWKHMAVHFLLIALIALIFPQYWLGLLLIAVLHFLIDACKILYFKQEKSDQSKIVAFLLDQLAHVLVIFLVINYYFEFITLEIFQNTHFLLLITAYFFITYPVSVFIKVLLLPYSKEVELSSQKTENQKDELPQSLTKGGQYIGIIERLLVFTFIIIGQCSAVGFLITAKSVFRFGDLNQGKNRQFTEYVLIGTLLSFGLAILTALIYLYAKSVGIVTAEN